MGAIVPPHAFANFNTDATKPVVGKHVYCTTDGKTEEWGTIQKVNEDGTVEINVHESEGAFALAQSRVSHGISSVKLATSGDRTVPKTWWLAG